MMKHIVRYILLLGLVVGLNPPPALAQGPVPLTGDLDTKDKKQDMPPEALDAAREYLDVLRQLEDVIRDYAEYASDLDPQTRAEIAHAIKRFSTGIHRGNYTEDCRTLVKDINTYLGELRTFENEMKAGQEAEAQQAYEARLVESLRRELSMLGKLVEQDVSRNLEACAAHEQAIERYVQAQLIESREQVRERNLRVDLEVLQDSSLRATLERIESMRIDMPEPPEPPEAPRVDVVWETPRVPRSVNRAGPVGSSRTLSGYLSYSTPGLPINITAPAGDLIIKATGSDVIEAVLEIEVTANTRADEKAFIEKTQLSLSTDRTGHHVTATYPKLRDPNTKLLSSVLVLTVPNNARVACQNSFGRLIVAEADLTVAATGNHSDMIFKDLSGKIVATNTMGSIQASNINGMIRAQNSYGPIQFDNCVGRLEIENSYDVVSLSNCDGETEIVNSGPTKVVNHAGPVMINNQNGRVDVSDVTGDLIAYNTYQPVRIAGIDGSAKIENANALISATDISGRIVAANRYGRITIVDVEGPMRLTNEFGAVDLFFNRFIPPRSTVSTTSDTITVWVSPSANVLVNAETLEGQISSIFPIERSNRGERQQGIIKLGDGRNRLDLSGTYSAIVVNETR